MAMPLPVFITGNQQKADYLSNQLGIELEHVKVELDELQSLDLHEIVSHKLRQAYQAVGKPVLVEDVSLSFTALGKLPGPFIKLFVDAAGAEACCRMCDGLSTREATIHCTFGYYDGKDMTFFNSEMKGSISNHPAGSNGFGFDSFFIMDGMHSTRAELPQEEVERTYATEMKPFSQVRAFLTDET